MKRTLIFCLLGLVLAVVCANLGDSAYDMTQGSDWKWSYAQTYVNDSLSKMMITDEDIAFARMKVAAAEEDCGEIGGGSGQWCKWAEEDRQALARMLKAQAAESADIPAGTSKTMWAKIKGFIKSLFGR